MTSNSIDIMSYGFIRQYKKCMQEYKSSSYCKLNVLNNLYTFNRICMSDSFLKHFAADWNAVYKGMKKLHDDSTYGNWFQSSRISDDELYTELDGIIQGVMPMWNDCLKNTKGDETPCSEGVIEFLASFNVKMFPHMSVTPKNVFLHIELEKK